jgi:DNA-binding transcriptional ArsR family regulator
MTDAARTIDLTDARALRALAHPVRLSLLGLLRRRGPLTATEAGKLLGETPTTCSFHLRQLARYRLVEEAGGGRGRARPWKATALFTNIPDAAADPDVSAASDVLSSIIAERYSASLIGWIERRRNEPEEWRDAALFSDTMMYLTADELRQLRASVQDLLREYEHRLDDPGSRPPGARLIDAITLAFPMEPA